MEEYGQTINQRKDVIINESYRVNDILWGDSFREKEIGVRYSQIQHQHSSISQNNLSRTLKDNQILKKKTYNTLKVNNHFSIQPSNKYTYKSTQRTNGYWYSYLLQLIIITTLFIAATSNPKSDTAKEIQRKVESFLENTPKIMENIESKCKMKIGFWEDLMNLFKSSLNLVYIHLNMVKDGLAKNILTKEVADHLTLSLINVLRELKKKAGIVPFLQITLVTKIKYHKEEEREDTVTAASIYSETLLRSELVLEKWMLYTIAAYRYGEQQTLDIDQTVKPKFENHQLFIQRLKNEIDLTIENGKKLDSKKTYLDQRMVVKVDKFSWNVQIFAKHDEV